MSELFNNFTGTLYIIKEHFELTFLQVQQTQLHTKTELNWQILQYSNHGDCDQNRVCVGSIVHAAAAELFQYCTLPWPS